MELLRELVSDRILLFEDARNEEDFLPEGQALLQTSIDLLISQTELPLDTSLVAIRDRLGEVCTHKHGFHQEAHRGRLRLLEGKAVDGLLEFRHLDVVSALA